MRSLAMDHIQRARSLRASLPLTPAASTAGAAYPRSRLGSSRSTRAGGYSRGYASGLTHSFLADQHISSPLPPTSPMAPMSPAQAQAHAHAVHPVQSTALTEGTSLSLSSLSSLSPSPTPTTHQPAAHQPAAHQPLSPSERVELAELRAAHAILTNKVAALTETNTKLARDANDKAYYKDALEGAEQELRTAISSIAAWKKEVAAYKAANPDMDSVLALSAQVKDAHARIASLENELDAARAGEAQARQDLAAANEALADARNTVRSVNPVSNVLHLTAQLRDTLAPPDLSS